MNSTHMLSQTCKMCVGISKSFEIIIRLEELQLSQDTFNILTQKYRSVFDIKYSAYTNTISCNDININLEFSSKSRIFPATISIASKIDNKKCKLDREAFLKLIELAPAVNFKIRIINEMSPYIVFRNMKCSYIKSDFSKDGDIKSFIANYLNNIPMLHAQYLSEFLVYFPIKMYDCLANTK